MDSQKGTPYFGMKNDGTVTGQEIWNPGRFPEGLTPIQL